MKKKHKCKKKLTIDNCEKDKLIAFTFNIIIMNKNKIAIAPMYTTKYTNDINSIPYMNKINTLKKIQPTKLKIEYIGFWKKTKTSPKNMERLLKIKKKKKYTVKKKYR